MYSVAYNTSDGPVVIDSEGRTLGGGEWGPVRANAPEVGDAGGRGVLHLYPNLDTEPGQNPAASDAVMEVGRLNDRAAAFAAHDHSELATWSAANGGDPDGTDDELVDHLARSSYDPPAPAGATAAEEA